MQIPSVPRLIHLFLAFFADCNIRRDKDFPFRLFALNNLKIFINFRIFNVFYIHLQDCCTFRRLFTDHGHKSIHLCFWRLCENLYIRTFVTDAPMDITSRCVTAYGWAKTDSLNNSVDTDSSSHCFFHLYASRFFISSRNFPDTAKCVASIKILFLSVLCASATQAIL